MNAAVRAVRRLSAAQWLLRAVMVAGLLLGAAGPAVDGHAPGAGYLLLAAALALVAAAAPGSHAGAPAMIWVLLGWLLHEPTGLGAGVLLAAVGLVAAHIAANLTSYVPPLGGPDGALVRVWLWRGLLVLIPAVACWAVVRLVGAGGEQLWVAGALVVVVAGIGVSLVMGGRERSDGAR